VFAFDLELPNEAVVRFATVGDIARYMSRRCPQCGDFPAGRSAKWSGRSAKW
jgi:hypothetical protein